MVVLSPHSDDAAFSLAAVMDSFAKAGASIDLVTCFSCSCYSRHLGTKSEREVTARRKLEDSRFARLVGGKCFTHWLDQPDSELRGTPLGETLRQHELNSRELSILDSMLETIAPLIFPEILLLAPMAVGNHIDHQIVYRLGAKLVQLKKCWTCFYEEIPYKLFSRWNAADATEKLRQLNVSALPYQLLFEDCYGLKERASGCYDSQVTRHEVESLLQQDRKGRQICGAEYIWIS